MKKIVMMLFLLVFMTSFSFANTLTFKGSSTVLPKALQGNWTETALSHNRGGTWIDGLNVPFKITSTAVVVENIALEVVAVSTYIDDTGKTGYVLKFLDSEVLFEFWISEPGRIILLIHKDHIESLRCTLIR